MALELVNRLPYDHPYRWDGTEVGGQKLWRPDELGAGLALWLDAEDTASISLNPLNNSGVVQWNDKSGNERHVSQAAVSQQPAYNVTGLNGKPTITFDGTNDILLNQNAGSVGVTNISMFMVTRYVTGAGEDISMGIGQTGQTGAIRVFYRAGSGTTQGFASWARDVSASSLPIDMGGVHHIFEAVQPNAATVNLFRDGTAGTGNPYTFSPAATVPVNFNGFSIGSLQGPAVGNYYSNIQTSEVIVSYTALSTDDRQKLEGYLAWKWGLEANLPVNHPYKNSPPTVVGTLPTVDTPLKTGITSNSAILGGNVASDGGLTITERGVVISLTSVNNDPLIGGTGVTKLTTSGTTGFFTLTATGLLAESGYSYKAFAVNGIDTAYSSVDVFTTLEPEITFKDLLFGDQPRSSVVGHKLWTWDEPYGLANTHPDIHQLAYTVINEGPTTRWKVGLPGLNNTTITTEARVASVTTGPATVTLPVREAQELADQARTRNQGLGEVGITMNRWGSGQTNAGGFPFIGNIFQSTLDAPQGWCSSFAADWYTTTTTPVVVTNGEAGQTPSVTNGSNNWQGGLPWPGSVTDGNDTVDSMFMANGVEYWSGWMTAFCTEWKRLQKDDPNFNGSNGYQLPDPAAFWYDTEGLNEIGNIMRWWSTMLDDPRADDINAIPGLGKTLRQIHLEIESQLDPSDRLPANTLPLSYANYINLYPEWSSLAGAWLHAAEAAAMRVITDDEILSFFPGALIGNWYTSSNHRQTYTSGANTVTFIRPDRHGTHASHVFYELPLSRLDDYNQSESLKPQAPWVFHPARWGSINGPADVDNWELGGDVNLSADLQTKYAAEIAAASGDTQATNLLLSKIYWWEAMSRFADAGVRNFLLWWNPDAVSGINTTEAGNFIANFYDEYLSDTPSTPLAKYIEPEIGLLVASLCHRKLKNGIKSWSIMRSTDSTDVILKINRSTMIGKFGCIEHALQAIVALHIRLGAKATTEDEQRNLKQLIDAKYVTEI